MSSAKFDIIEHVSPCQHIREYAHGAISDDAVLQIAVKEYRPRNAPEPKDDAVTIIASHGNGFPKECYEAMWDDLLDAAKGFSIRAIWMADHANQAASYPLNAAELGDDTNWLDHSRDLLLMINHFRDRMKPPFVGIGHSMGGAQIAHLANIHPRLFTSLILIDPVIQDWHPPGPNVAMFSSMRRETWDSREKAESQISKNGFFQSMDSRVLKSYLSHALRDTSDGKVVLATPKAQEAWSYLRCNFHPLPKDSTTSEARNFERLLNPDVEPFTEASNIMFMRPECAVVFNSLGRIRPRTLYIYGDFSHINFDEVREKQVAATGIERGGNGGRKDGNVEMTVVEDGGHLCCFEQPAAVARDISTFLDKDIARWRKERDFWRTYDKGKSKDAGTALSEKWIAGTKLDSSTERPKPGEGSKL